MSLHELKKIHLQDRERFIAERWRGDAAAHRSVLKKCLAVEYEFTLNEPFKKIHEDFEVCMVPVSGKRK